MGTATAGRPRAPEEAVRSFRLAQSSSQHTIGLARGHSNRNHEEAGVVTGANDLQDHDNSFNGGRCAPAAAAAAAFGAKARSPASATQPIDKRRGRQPTEEQERLKRRSQRKSNKNNASQHHYDYCSGPDLAAPLHHLGSPNYGQNILLFATEHGATSGPPPSPPPAAKGRVPNGHSNPTVDWNQNRKPPNRGFQLGATGKFVSHYPTYASAKPPSSNYSFHVPLKTATAGGFRRHLQPTGLRASGGRSRTIAHLPLIDSEQSTSDEGSPVKCNGSSCYEDFYERPESSAELRRLNCGQYMMLSEGDLLRVRQGRLAANEQQEQDNPFRPGTELSWAADLMVRLIQRGYPIEELPQLVAAAKELAERPPTSGATLPAGAKLQDCQEASTKRGKSACDLSASGKRVWANSLRRAKSMPRVAREQDNNSLDRLITSIEQEMIGCSLAELEAANKSEAKVDRTVDRKPVEDSIAKIRDTKMMTSNSNSRKKLADCCVVQ